MSEHLKNASILKSKISNLYHYLLDETFHQSIKMTLADVISLIFGKEWQSSCRRLYSSLWFVG